VPDLLEMWELLAPDYTASSVRRAPGLILDLLESFSRLPDEPEDYAASMWELHHTLIAYCDNLVYGLIFNTFQDFYHQLARYYYTEPDRRQLARELWTDLEDPIQNLDTQAAAELVSGFVSRTKEFWQDLTFEQYQKEVLEETEERTDKNKESKKKKAK
jgi:GntR family negative regulator for fad regulon and positive regulator of fabA